MTVCPHRAQVWALAYAATLARTTSTAFEQARKDADRAVEMYELSLDAGVVAVKVAMIDGTMRVQD